MINMPLDDFIEEIKAELAGYEEIEEEKIRSWEDNFRKLISEEKTSKISYKKDKNTISLKDESDIFAFADNYFASLEYDNEDDYWESFK